MTAEHDRLEAARERAVPWKQWGPYLSERQWGTVREDYSEGGDAWSYFSHDQARSRAYRWGEDGLAGISDHKQRLCFALALWNGSDPILKERLFGLTNSEGNHGEDVKEYYFYLDSTPTHSYMKYLYKYPQSAFPYADLVETNRRRGRGEFEYELIDTGVFDEDRYFDAFVEYAKESAQDILIQVTIHNRGPDPAEIHVLPTLWFRNLWSWRTSGDRPLLRQEQGAPTCGIISASGPDLGELYLYCDRDVPLLFTENETNTQRIFGVPNRTPYVKDGINNCVVLGQGEAVNPGKSGTKAAAHYRLAIEARRTPSPPAAPHRRRSVRRQEGLRPARTLRRPLRGGAAFAPAGGRRVLCGHHAARPRRGRGERHAAGTGGHAVVQAVLPLRRGQVAGRARVRSLQADPEGGAPQRPLAPHVQRRRDLDAGQVGVSLVRGLGPRLPRARADARRPGVRQAAASADAARAVHAPQRPDPGLRVELRRCQPAGPCLVHHLHLPPREGADGRRRPGLAQGLLPEAVAEFHLVGQPQGPFGSERLRGRLPGPGQHRGLRSERAPADRGLPGTGRRHRLDGPLLPEHARDRRGAGDDRSGLRGHGPQVLRALPVDRLGDGAPGAGHGNVGRGRRLLLRRAPAARRPGRAPQGPVDGGPAAAVRGHDLRG